MLSSAEKAACGLTVAATEGPFWVSGVAELKGGDLNTSNLPGQPLSVSGHVYDGATGTTPVPGAEVEIWHADSAGAYHPNGNGAATRYKPEEIALRGFLKTDAKGVYSFTTVMPGEYTGRARHIHFKIRAPGKAELTTQLIIPAQTGDKLTFDNDDIAKGLPNCQQIKIDASAIPAKASFDFRL